MCSQKMLGSIDVWLLTPLAVWRVTRPRWLSNVVRARTRLFHQRKPTRFYFYVFLFLAKVRTIDPAKGPESSLVLRTSQRLSTRLWCWNAWPRGIPRPSSPGAAQTVKPLTCTTPRSWATETWLSPMSVPSTVGSTSAGPRPPEPATTPSLRPTSQFKVRKI